MKKTIKKNNGWSEEEREAAWRARHPVDGSQPINYEDLSKRLEENFGSHRTPSAIQQEISMIRIGKRKTTFELSPGDSRKTGGIFDPLVSYDVTSVDPVMRKRRDFIYDLMRKQADLLGQFEAYKLFTGKDISEILKSGSDLDKKRLVSLLESGVEDPKIKNIELLAMPGWQASYSEGNVGILLPIFVSDIQKGSKPGIKSALHDLTIATLGSKGSGMRRANPPRLRMNDLLVYGFSTNKQPDYNSLGQKITEGLSIEFSDVKVMIHEDKLFSGNSYGILEG